MTDGGTKTFVMYLSPERKLEQRHMTKHTVLAKHNRKMGQGTGKGLGCSYDRTQKGDRKCYF